MNILRLVWIFLQYFQQSLMKIIQFCKNGYHFSFSIVLIAQKKKHKSKEQKNWKPNILKTFFNHAIFLDTKGPLNAASEGKQYNQ